MKLTDIFTISPSDYLINTVKKSIPAEFYSEMMTGMKKKDEVEGGGETPTLIKEIVERMCNDLPGDAVLMELGGSFYQRRCGYLKDHFINYFPVNLSIMDMVRYSQENQRIAVAADAVDLPVEDLSVDAVFTHAFLEHPINPKGVVQEVCRTVKKGGMVVHVDAWHCRWWQRFGVVGIKEWRDMTVKERIITLVAKVTEFPLVRKTFIILRRSIREILQPKSFKYKKLNPNYDLKLGSDEDAANSIDPIDLVRFYRKYGFIHDPPLSRFERIFFNKRYIYLIRET